ncbi:hypothetical protein JDV02_009718 [Purpureocillium takamizusanense]|uniref:Uncharacterized protein n=1 Tax=Purpureocillium takamizusanense TaxID=2060973 RepID=A0A9Q8VFS9_9HYPO|nr:uncharacterized protein JDV02_009718 [Purpureocillium takamizusanense]UNI23928.1 hypothetical protein JDV02_009718 [Purpureocillium takamizusanense]
MALEEDNVQYICVDKPRCGLCQFRFEDNELVVAVYDDNRMSGAFGFRRTDTRQDESVNIALHMCCQSRCYRSKRRVPCLHRECYSFQMIPISSNYLAATNYDFNPSIQLELQRQRRIEWAVAKRLKGTFLAQMPQELCRIVARYIIRELAAVALQERAKDTQPSVSTINLTRDVYATYTDIEGITYIQSLRNSPQDDCSSRRIYDAQQARVPQTIHVEYDHLGIRGIYFDAHNSEPRSFSARCGVWWTETARESGLSRITTKSDGVKLRRLVDATDSVTVPFPRVLGQGWPAPRLVCQLLDLDTCDTAKNSPTSLRMSSFEFNTPETSGYCVAIFGFNISKIYAHQWNTNASFYSDLVSDSSSTLWMYMPVDEEEHLTHIWAVRHSESGLVGLIFHTNQDRKALFGCYMVHPKFQLQFHLIYSTTRRPSRVYFNEWDPFEDEKRLKYIGIESDATGTNKAIKQRLETSTSMCPLPLTSTPPPYTQYNEPWYYTYCMLENVVEIACCVDRTISHRPIIGMLMYYGDGHRACIGQYRLDWVVDRFSVDPAMLLRIGLAKTRRNLPYVVRICLRKPAATVSGPISWMDVPWQGKLEWWFSQRQCRLYHCD